MAYNNIPVIVALWEHFGYGGRRLVLTEDSPDLGVYGFHDMASSGRTSPLTSTTL
jgi:hypothetical protein